MQANAQIADMTAVAKLRELFLYIAERSSADARFGAVKLNQILYYSDFRAYALFGNSITGCTYKKLDQGPVPREILELKRRYASHDFVEVKTDDYGKKQTRILPLRKPSISWLTAEQIKLVDSVIEEFWHLNGAQISELSHQEAGWRAAKLQEEIPYETAFVSRRDLYPSEYEYGNALADELEE